jgi:hypothetical protein
MFIDLTLVWKVYFQNRQMLALVTKIEVKDFSFYLQWGSSL